MAVGPLFLQLFLTLVSLSTMGNGGNGKTTAQMEHVSRKKHPKLGQDSSPYSKNLNVVIILINKISKNL